VEQRGALDTSDVMVDLYHWYMYIRECSSLPHLDKPSPFFTRAKPIVEDDLHSFIVELLIRLLCARF
jgi:hypothetical protein